MKLFFILFIAASLGVGSPLAIYAQNAEVPENFEEGTNFIIGALKAVPDAFAGVWTKAVLPVWTTLWNDIAIPVGTKIWNTILGFFGQQIEEKKSQLEQEIAKEREELTQGIETELEEAKESLWERFLALFDFAKTPVNE